MKLRPYQQASIDGIREIFKSGKRKALLHLATGAGKTVVFSHMMITSVSRGRRCIMVVRGRKLVDQASKRLFKEGVTHGVMMNGHWNFNPAAPIQICSVDTLIARGWRPKADVIVIDEAHMAVSDGYAEFLKDYPEAFIIAVTATPYSNKPLTHIADEIVHPITVQELIDQGFLIPPKYFAPTDPDVSSVKVSRSTGDYVTKELSALMDKSSIMGDIISHWKRLGDNRPTIVFAVSVEHSQHIARQFNEAGITAEHCDAETPEKERDEIIKRIESGATKVVSNVGILCTGVDIPSIGCIVMARPTKSYNLYIQQVGRGTRPIFPEKADVSTEEKRLALIRESVKQNFILLDHAGNVKRHGFITHEPETNLKGKLPSGPMGVIPKTCKNCWAVVEEFPCQAEIDFVTDDGVETRACNWSPPPIDRGPRSLLQVDGELREILPPSNIEKYECDRFCEEQLDKVLARNQSPWKAFYTTKDKFGEQAARLSFFRLCKKHGIDVVRSKKEKTEIVEDGFPFK